jgi:hypothetical protein
MASSYCFTFCSLEMSVRYGDGDTNNNDIDIISCYVHTGLERAKNFSDIGAVHHAHMRVINTLIDTMCDHCLTSVWRKHCYRYIKRLLPLLYEMLNQEQYKQKNQEIQTLHAYFFADNQKKHQLHKRQHSNLPGVKEQPLNPKKP